MKSYHEFLNSKQQPTGNFGFNPTFLPESLFPFQKYLIEWALLKGRAAIFADCGLGKTLMSLVWCQNVIQHTNGKTLIVTPIAVGHQFVREGEKFGIECKVSRDGKPAGEITVTNYERLHHFNPEDYAGVVCDESSILKNYKGVTKGVVIEFLKKMKYRLLCTATPAPNDPIELGTTSEALGYMGTMDMLGTFFKNNEKSLHPAFIGSKWTFKPHAEKSFWKWVASWARAIRRPSDLGFSDDGFALPPKKINKDIIDRSQPLPGMLFAVPAVGLSQERQERKITISQRCERVAELVEHYDCSVLWGDLNAETDLLSEIIPDSVNIKGGKNDIDKREEYFVAFAEGEIKRLITKPKIGAFGLNWQHCRHMTFFPSHSYEQFYQGTRRIWRFGQKRPVVIDVVMSEAQERVFENLQRKSDAADKMFDMLLKHMNQAAKFDNKVNYNNQINTPSWLTSN